MDVLSSRVLLKAVDFEATLAFYTEILGLGVYREYGSRGHRTGVVCFAGGGFIEITAQEPRDEAGVGADADLWLQVPDLDAEQARLETRGVSFDADAETMPWGLREAWLRDPDGRHLVLVEVPPGHPIRSRLE